jgi:peptide/nickel transport system substrate-binding protein
MNEHNIDRRQFLGRSLVFSAGAVLLGSAVGCTTASSNSNTTKSNTANGQSVPTGSAIVVGEFLQGFGEDIMLSLTPPDKTYWDTIFDYPVGLSVEGRYVPALATSWEVSKDHLTWAFEVREGVLFHNGDTMTAGDMAFTFNRAMFNPRSQDSLISYKAFTDSIKADGNKLLIKTKVPVAEVPVWMAQSDGSDGGTVLSEKYFNKLGATAASRSPVGTGAYKFVSANGEQSLQLTAFLDPNRNDWQKARTPHIKDITIIAPQQESTKVALLKTGGADISPILSEDIATLQNTQTRVVSTPAATYAGMYYLGVTLNPKSPFNDVRVREALSIAIDRASLARVVYNGKAVPSAAFYGGPHSLGYPSDLAPPPFNPSRAKQLLAAANFGKSGTLQIVTYDNDGDFPGLPNLGEAIAGMYDNVGLKASVRVLDGTTMFQDIYGGTFPGMAHNSAVEPPTLFLRGFDNIVDMIPDTVTGYTNTGRFGKALYNSAEMQQRLEAAEAEFDQDKQNAMLAGFDRWMAANWYQVPLLAADAVFGVSSKIKSWQPIISQPQPSNLWTLTL